MENIRKPQILIQTDGITNTKIFIDGKELPGVAGVRFSQSYKENKGLPVLQIELKATNVTLDAKMLPALPEPYKGQYISISKLLASLNINSKSREAQLLKLASGSYEKNEGRRCKCLKNLER